MPPTETRGWPQGKSRKADGKDNSPVLRPEEPTREPKVEKTIWEGNEKQVGVLKGRAFKGWGLSLLKKNTAALLKRSQNRVRRTSSETKKEDASRAGQQIVKGGQRLHPCQPGGKEKNEIRQWGNRKV